MQLQNDNIEGPEPNSLTVQVTCPRLPSDHRGYLSNKYKHYLKFITLEEAEFLDNLSEFGPKFYKWDTPTDRVNKMNKYLEIIDKIDYEWLNEEILKDINRQIEEKKVRKHAIHELGPREFTLTYSPSWCSDDEARERMRIAIKKLMKYYSSEIVEFRAIGEVGKGGLSHVHCFYKLKGGLKITDKNFKRAYPPWDTKKKCGPTGHKGGHHANVRNEADFKGYIEKEINNAWLDEKFILA